MFIVRVKCGIMKVYDVEIQEYIDTHINEEHDYSFATDDRDYDMCIYCECVRYKDSNEWVVV
jgi:hypothetical protein